MSSLAFGCTAEDGMRPQQSGAVIAGPTAGTPGAGSGALVGGGAGGTGGAAGTVGTAGTAGTPAMPGAGTALPCDVAPVIASRCQTCHGAARMGGAPLSLLTVEDFQKDYVVATTTGLLGRTMKVHELAKIRVHAEMGTTPMPQGAPLAANELSALDAWLGAAAPATAASECEPAGGGGTGGMDGMSYEEGPLVARDGETCYDLPTHGGQTAGDTSPYMVAPGENYEQFYFNVPWTTAARGTRFGADFDNVPVLHHWLLFTTGLARGHGSHETVIGTQLGDATAKLLAGWAVGGKNVILPDDVEFELPPPNTMLNLQWHYYNSMATAQPDTSKVQVCTVPPGTRPNVGSITWLGTENFNGPIGMPPGENKFKGTCINDSGAPIHIFFFWPHMHQLGRRMSSVVQRAAGTTEQVFDMQFDFNYQVHYDSAVTLMPGDSIESTCTFNNTTPAGVPFGPSSEQEMCYQFAFSYPAGALDNGVPSLIGATNTCWQFGE